MFHEDDVDTGVSFVKLNEVGPATSELVDAEIRRLLQVGPFVANRMEMYFFLCIITIFIHLSL